MSELAVARPAAQPVTARPPLIDDLTTCEEAARVILFECLTHISANVEPVLTARAPEALHQLRVGLRRLRVALGNFAADSPGLPELKARAKILTNGLGAARDLDVFHDELFEPAVQRLGPQRGFELLRERAAHARQKAWQQVTNEVASTAFASFRDDVAAAAQSVTWRGTVPIGEAVPELMTEHFNKARKRGKRLAEKSAPERHRLRIALKRLRYSSEFFAPLYPPDRVRGFVQALKDLQGLLGHLNDAAQARAMLGRLMMEDVTTAREQADLGHAAGLIQGYHQAHADVVAKKAVKRWKRFKKAEPFWA
jgi:triphosphatase